MQCVRPIVDLLTGVDDLRFEIVPGGHLGMLTGRAARRTTWRILDEWITAHSSEEAAEPTPTARRVTGQRQRASAKKAVAARPRPNTTATRAPSAPTRNDATAPQSSRTLARK